MAYDAAKAHEYYENYVKKGKKKGRKKGKSKKKSSTRSRATSLVGLSTAGLNDAGKMEAALVKEKIQNEMNEALKKAATPAEKEKVRKEYQNKALKEITALKNNADFAKAKAASKKSTSSKSSGGSSGKSSGGSSKGSSGSSTSSGSGTSGTTTTQKVADISAQINAITDALKNISNEKKGVVREVVGQLIKQLQSMKGVNTSGIIDSLERLK